MTQHSVVGPTGSTSAAGGAAEVAEVAAAIRRPRRRRGLQLIAALVLLALLGVLSIAIGSREVSFDDLAAGLAGTTDSLATAAVSLRVARTVLAILVGAALAIAGVVLQGVTRNPLADPGILGINTGASLAVVVGIAWFGLTSATGFIWVAIVGAAVSALFVYGIGSLGRGGATPLKLALAGAATSAAFVSFITAVALPRADLADNIRSWQIGGVGGASFDRILLVLPFFAAGALLCLGSARALNSLALGDDVAAGLGERVALVRAASALGAVLLCGAATAIAGPIGFVGLVVPHLFRLLVGIDHRWLLPFSALGGACLLVAADVLGRVVARPSEIDVGIITALVVAPFFIWIVRRQKLRSL